MVVEILDGAIGTELIARGFPAQAPDWTARAAVEAPDLLGEVHRDYARAGATIHTANTFRTQPRVLRAGWRDALDASVAIVRGAALANQRVAGSIAPVSDCYRPDLSPGAGAREEHRQVASALASAGCDLLLCETFANEAEALVAAEEAVQTGLPTWLSLTAGPFADLLTPRSLRGIAKRALSTGIERLLVNCVAASLIEPYVDAIVGLGVPIGVYANAGDREEGIGWGATGRAAAEAYATFAERWVDAGATVVGGCCGTSPLHIAALVERFG
jgi:S-methylmethionine-dependent homocysteine/selenocysteine methylase